MPRAIDKAMVLTLLRERVAEDLEAITASQLDAQAGATHAEARPEDAKDTRATEGSYLARGLSSRVNELRKAVMLLDRLQLRSFGDDAVVALTALVEVEDDDGVADVYFLAPAGAGIKVDVNGVEVSVVTLKSPLGRALVGKHVDDEVTLNTPGGKRLLAITTIQ